MDVGTLTVTMGANTAGLARAQQAMIQLQQQTMKSVNAMNASLNSLSAQMTKVAAKSKVAGQSVAAIGKPAVSAMSNISSALGQITSGLQRFGYLATTTLTLPIVMAGRAAFTMAKDYEFSIQKIVGLTGVAQSVVNGWEKELLAMAPEVAKGPKELADALYFISSSGIKGAEAMNVLKLSAKAASAGLGDTQTVADLLTSALNAYRGTGLTAAYATDVLVAAVREGKAEATGFSSAMGQVIPIAAQLGVSFDQVAGGMAAITLTGSTASQAAVYLKGVFNSLLKATTQGEKALKQTGNSYAGLRKILAEGGVIPLMQRLRDIQLKYGDELLSDVLPNIRALTGYLSLAGKNFKYNSDLMNRVTNSSGSLAKAINAVSDSIKFRYDAAIAGLQSSTMTLAKDMVQSFLPTLEKIAKQIGEVAKSFNELTDSQKRHRVEFLAFLAILGPASLLISAMVWIVRGLVVAFTGLGNAIKIVNVGLDAMGFKMLKLPKWLLLGNLKSTILSGLGFLGSSGAAAMIGGVGIAAGGAAIALSKYAKKVKEIAKEHDLYYTTLVNVNGELKKLKDLTGSDVEAMTQSQVSVSMDQVRKAWIAAEAGWKQAEKNKGLGWKINQKDNLKQQVEYARQIAEYSKLYNEMTNAYLLGNMTGFDKVQKKMDAQVKSWQELQKEITRVHKLTLDQYQAQLKVEDHLMEGLQFRYTASGNRKFGKMGESQLQTVVPDAWDKVFQANKRKPDPWGLQERNKEITAVSKIFNELTDKQPVIRFFPINQEDPVTILENWNARGLINEREFLDDKYKMDIANAAESADAKLKIETQYIKDLRALRMADVQSYLNSASNAISAISSLIEASKQKELSAVGQNARARERIEKEYMQKQKAWAIAQAIINGALAITNLIAQVPLSVLNPATWVGIGIAAASTAAQVAIIAGQKMKVGGVVPSGYPNDTYPALLTSGEMVTPPGKLSGIERQQSLAAQLKDVVFHIEGTQLVGVFKNQSRKQLSYS